MNLTRFDPLRELDDLSRRLNTWFGEPMRHVGGQDTMAFSDWVPALDVEETDDEYLVTADLPAIRKEDLKINIDEGMLSLEGERKFEKDEKKKTYHRMERSYGRFVRKIMLPGDADPQKVKADFKDGVLHVHLPKSEKARPRTIDVNVM